MGDFLTSPLLTTRLATASVAEKMDDPGPRSRTVSARTTKFRFSASMWRTPDFVQVGVRMPLDSGLDEFQAVRSTRDQVENPSLGGLGAHWATARGSSSW